MLTPPSMLTIKNRGAEGSRDGFLKPDEQVPVALRRHSSERLFRPVLECPKLFALLLTCIGIWSGCMPAGPKALLEGKRLIEQAKYPRAIEKLNHATSLLST